MSQISRIVSFLPSATELIYKLGADKMLKGVTHECNFPEDATTKPRIITSVVDSEKYSSKEIDKQITQLANEGKSIYKLNENKLKSAAPDLIISQQICKVCSAYTQEVDKAIQLLESRPKVYSFSPHNLEGILETITDVAGLIGKENEGRILKQQFQQEIEIIKSKQPTVKKRVLALEWLDPFFSVGHWVPEMIDIAGGKCVIGNSGDHSYRLSFKEVKESEPEVIILMPCGFNVKRTKEEYNKYLKDSKEWSEIKAVKKGQVYAVDANSFFSKPSIRTITGIKILANIINPEFKDISVPSNSIIKINNH